MSTYTYTIFDSDPMTSSGTAWPTHEDVEIEADSNNEALDLVREVMCAWAAHLNPSDGYDPDQYLYAIVWDADGVQVGYPTYVITAEDIGVEDSDLDPDEYE